MKHLAVYTHWAQGFNRSDGALCCSVPARSPAPLLFTLSTHKRAFDVRMFMLAMHTQPHRRACMLYCVIVLAAAHKDRRTTKGGRPEGWGEKFEAVTANPHTGIAQKVTTDGVWAPRPRWIWHGERERHELPPLWGRSISLRMRCTLNTLLHICSQCRMVIVVEEVGSCGGLEDVIFFFFFYFKSSRGQDYFKCFHKRMKKDWGADTQWLPDCCGRKSVQIAPKRVRWLRPIIRKHAKVRISRGATHLNIF